jgi:hypothetical protein
MPSFFNQYSTSFFFDLGYTPIFLLRALRERHHDARRSMLPKRYDFDVHRPDVQCSRRDTISFIHRAFSVPCAIPVEHSNSANSSQAHGVCDTLCLRPLTMLATHCACCRSRCLRHTVLVPARDCDTLCLRSRCLRHTVLRSLTMLVTHSACARSQRLQHTVLALAHNARDALWLSSLTMLATHCACARSRCLRHTVCAR